MKTELEKLRDYFAGDGDEETRQAIRRELEQPGTDLYLFLAKVVEVSHDWFPVPRYNPEVASRSHSFNMTELALKGRTPELEREFRLFLPALLDHVKIPPRERSAAFIDALVALVIGNSQHLAGRKFRECVSIWINEFLVARGFVGTMPLEIGEWETLLVEVATDQALERMEETLQPMRPGWFQGFKRLVKQTSATERIPLKFRLEEKKDVAEFAQFERVFNPVAVAVYEELQRFWELN